MKSVLLREDTRDFTKFWTETIPYKYGGCTEIEVRKTRTSNKIITQKRVTRFGRKPPYELLNPDYHKVISFDLGYIDDTKTRKVYIYSYESTKFDKYIECEPLEL